MMGVLVCCCTLSNIPIKHLPAPLKEAEDGWLIFGGSTSTPHSLKSASASMTFFNGNTLRTPFMPRYDVDFIYLGNAAEFGGFFLATTPSRSCLVTR